MYLSLGPKECYLNNPLLGQSKYTKKFRYWHKSQSDGDKVKTQCKYEREIYHKSCQEMIVQISFSSL